MIRKIIFKILILLLFMLLVRTSHFQGGTITYKIVNTYGSTVSIMITQTYLYRWALIYCDNSRILSQSTPNFTNYADYKANLTCVSNCSTTGGYSPVPVRSYCTDYSAAMSISVTQRTDIVNLTSGAYFVVAFQGSAWRALNLPVMAASSNWSIACTIDLRIRSDTGKPNTPPVATMISPIYIPVGNRSSIVIPTIDGDNDIVRCRFADKTIECSNECPPGSLPNNTVIISSNCTLFITGAKVGDWYAITIQIEDFINSSSTTPLSSVPVQFLVNVQALPNCTNAPLLYGPSNQTGTCQSLQVGQAQTMTLYAVNYCSAYGVIIEDIATLSFPIVIKSNLTKNSSTLYSVTLTWTPTAQQVGSQILCAVAFDSQNVQSNQYCVAFVVSVNSTGSCPGTVVETTTSLATTTQIFNNYTSFIDTVTTHINYNQSTANNTTAMAISTADTTTAMAITTADNTMTMAISTEDDTTLITIGTADDTTTLAINIADDTTTMAISTEDDTTLITIGTADDTTTMAINIGDDTTTTAINIGDDTTAMDISTADDTTVMTTTTTISTTTSSSSNGSPWLLPLIAVLASLLPLICCLCLCCPPPYGFGLLCPKRGRDRSLKPPTNPDEPRRSPRMYMIGRIFGKSFDNDSRSGSSLASSKSTTASDKNSDRFPLTLRNNMEKGKNAVWVYPALPSDNASRLDNSLTNSRSPTPSDKHLDSFPLTLRNNANKTEKNVVWVHPSLPSDNISGQDNNLANSRSPTPSDKHLDSFPLTLRNRSNLTEKNVVWVHPSSRLDNVNERDTSLASPRSINASDIHLDVSSPTPRNSASKNRNYKARSHLLP